MAIAKVIVSEFERVSLRHRAATSCFSPKGTLLELREESRAIEACSCEKARIFLVSNAFGRAGPGYIEESPVARIGELCRLAAHSTHGSVVNSVENLC